MCGLDEAGLTVERLRLALVPEKGFTKTGIEPLAGLRRSPAIVTSSAASTRVLDVLPGFELRDDHLALLRDEPGGQEVDPAFVRQQAHWRASLYRGAFAQCDSVPLIPR